MVIDMKRIISIVLFAVAILCSCEKTPKDIHFLDGSQLHLVKGTTYQLQVALFPSNSKGDIRFHTSKVFDLN